ncbi:monothiol glutaredoxin grx4 [Tulasnella sp. 403]|nr:monothiol glutaredoxin grx4 [Tulasnella sp. 403]
MSETTTTTATTNNYHEVKTVEGFKKLMEEDLQRISLLSFWAPWAEPCKQMNQVVQELARKHPGILVLSIEAEELSDIAESFEVEAVPTMVLLRGHTLLTRIAGADAAKLTAAVEQHAKRPPPALSKTDKPPAAPSADVPVVDAPKKDDRQPPAATKESDEELNARMHKLMNQSKVVLFMKGNPDEPRCGFSRKTVAILREQQVEFTHFDILKDEAVRQGMKKLNDWPTFPQLIIDGELFGGLDILRESIETGEFAEVKAGL